MDYQLKPINPFQDDGLSKEDRAMIDGMRETAYICGKRGGDVEHAVHQTLKRWVDMIYYRLASENRRYECIA